MEKLLVGEKKNNLKYDFRETCFGICEKQGNLLLVEKNGQYSFIGGGIEKGESQEHCLKREFLEESGYEIESMEKFITVDCYWLAGGKWPLNSLVNFYVVKVGNQKHPPLEEGHTLAEVDIEKAMDLLPLPYHKAGLKFYLKNKNQPRLFLS